MDKEIMKIPILGIQNAGKTSLIRTLQREFNAITKLKPTKGIERQTLNILGKKIIIWDLGGQAKYRGQYLEKKAELVFSDIDQALYVIDIQDQDSFEDSINYFKEVKNRISDYSPEAKIHILIHKFDPNMEQDPVNMEMLEVLKLKFKEIAAPLKLVLYHTTIFNPISVIHAFSKPILGNNQIKLRDVAHNLFQKFTKKTMALKEIKFQTDFTMVEMKQFSSNKRRFYFTYGYDVENSSNIDVIREDIAGLLDAVEKLMIYF